MEGEWKPEIKKESLLPRVTTETIQSAHRDIQETGEGQDDFLIKEAKVIVAENPEIARLLADIAKLSESEEFRNGLVRGASIVHQLLRSQAEADKMKKESGL